MKRPDHGLGRLPAPDPRDKKYLLRAALPPAPPRPPSVTWWDRWDGDQNGYPFCVGFAWRGWLSAGPVTTPGGPDPVTIYREAQIRDEWEGESYEGTSVRAGAKYLQEMGLIPSYRWAFTLEDVLEGLSLGPMVLGTTWLLDMEEPDSKGFIHAGGSVLGGHAYRAIGYSDKRKAVRIRNSWGLSWGQRGRAWLSYDDLTLLLADDGEACIAIEAP